MYTITNEYYLHSVNKWRNIIQTLKNKKLHPNFRHWLDYFSYYIDIKCGFCKSSKSCFSCILNCNFSSHYSLFCNEILKAFDICLYELSSDVQQKLIFHAENILGEILSLVYRDDFKIID